MVQRIGEIDDEVPASSAVKIGEVEPPSMGEVLAPIPENVGLGLISAGGGATQAIGDLLRIESLSELGADVARNARGAREENTPAGMSTGQEVLSLGLESALTMLPALAVGPASLAATGVTLAAGQQGASRYAELRDAGFSGGRAGLHASIDALAEGLGEAVALPVLAQASRPFLNKLVQFVTRDLVGEEFTTVMQQGNAMLSDRPDMTWGEFLEGMKMTALVAPIAAGGQMALAGGAQAIRRAVTPGGDVALEDAPPTLPPVQVPPPQDPVPVPAGAPLPPSPTQEGAPPPDPPNQEAPPTPPTPPAPEADPLPDWLKDATTTPGEPRTLQAPQGRIDQVPGNAWDVGVMTQDGRLQSMFEFPDLRRAIRAADELGLNLTLPDGVAWGDGKLQLGDDWYATPELRNNDGAITWKLYDGQRRYTSSYSMRLADALPKMLILRDAGFTPAPPKPLPSAPKPAAQAGFGSMYTTLPQEMRARNRYDPRLYNSATIQVTRSPGGIWDIRYRPMRGIPQDYQASSVNEALNILRDMKGYDIRQLSEAELETVYKEGFMADFTANPDNWLDVTQEVDEYFGGRLTDIASNAATRNKGLAKVLPGGLEEGRHLVGNSGDPIASIVKPGTYLGPTGKKYRVYAGQDVTSLGPGVFAEGKILSTPFGKKAQAWLEHLRKKYLPNVTLILREGDPGDRWITGGMASVREGIGLIFMSDLVNGRQALWGDVMYALAHELTHAVIAQEFSKAPAAVQAKVVDQWLQYTRDVKKDDSLAAYLLTHHGHPRDVDRLQDTIAASSAGFRRYVMSLSEYLADQGANHIMESRSGVDSDVIAWVQAMVARIQELFKEIFSHGDPFRKNLYFAEFLDELAGKHAGKVSSTKKTKAKVDPPLDAKDIASLPPGTKPMIFRDQHHAEQIIRKMTKLFQELERVGADPEEVKALNPTGNPAYFNWDAAYKLAHKYGIPFRAFDESNMIGMADDTSGFRSSLSEMAGQLNDPEISQAIGQANSAVKSFNWLFQKTLTAVQLRKRFGATVPGVKAFVDSLERMFSYRSRWKEMADDRVKQMKLTSKVQRDKVFELLLDEDQTGKFASTITRDVAGKRIFTLDQAALQKWGLDAQGVALYQGMRQDFDAALEEMEYQAEQELGRLYSQGPALQQALTHMRDGFNQMKARPYVPHTRFGDHTVSVRNGNGQLQEFYQFETEIGARRFEQSLRSSYPSELKVSRGKLTEQQRLMMGLPPQLINAMKSQLDLSAEQIAQFEDILKDMSNGASFVRRFKRRKNVAGWLDDAENLPRAYADYMSRFANHVSRMKYNHILTASTTAVRQQATEESKTGANTVELNELANWLSRLQKYVNEPGVEYNNARAAATLWYLGANVKSALVNSTSVPMVTYPYLSKRFGLARAGAVITQSYKDIAKMYLRPQALTDDERKMLQYLREQGKIDASFASELAGLREGGRLSDRTALSRPAAAGFAVKYYGMWLFQKMEIINRQVTALAAYRLQKQNRTFDPGDPMGFDKAAADYAGLSIQDTQNENAQWNRSEFMRGRKSVLTMFMSYQQNIIYQMLGGDESWMRLLAAQLMMGGLMGIPFAADLDELIKWFAREVFGSDMNAEKAVRAMLKDTIVDADWMLKGASHNVFGIDLSGSLSQGRVIPGVDALAMQGDFPDKLANAASDVGGAGVSIIMNMLKALASDDPSAWRRWQRMFPEFIRSTMEGATMLSGGKALDGRGRVITEVSDGEAMMRMLGFQVSDVAQERGKRFAQRDTAQFWLTRRAYVLSTWELAMQTRDPAWRRTAQEALKEFNAEAPDRALKITNAQLQTSLKRRLRADDKAGRGEAPTRTVEGTYRRVGDLYR